MKSFRYAVLSILLCCSTEAFSWDSFGHMLIAELALDELSPAKQRQIEQEAFSLVRQQASKQRLYLMRTFPDTSVLRIPIEMKRLLRFMRNLLAKFPVSLPR